MYSVGQCGKAPSSALGMQNLIFENGASPSLFHSHRSSMKKIRLALSASLPSPPPKKRRLNSRVGTEAPDMSLITPETAHTRGGWKVTEMGRVVRVTRMRPERPLEPPRVTATSAGNKKREMDGKSTGRHKKRVKPPPTRARRRTIDPTRWDSVHLKGIWLDAEVAGAVETSAGLGRSGRGRGDRVGVAEDAGEHVIQRKRRAGDAECSNDEHGTDSAVSTESEDDDHESVSSSVPESAIPPLPSLALSPFSTAHPPPIEPAAEEVTPIPQEKLASLALLRTLFSDKDGDEGWGGQESLSDVEESKGKGRESQMVVDEDDVGSEIEEVPRANFKGAEMRSDTSDEVGSPLESQAQSIPRSGHTTQNQTQIRLKDLFAPREDEGMLCYINFLHYFRNVSFSISFWPNLTD